MIRRNQSYLSQCVSRDSGYSETIPAHRIMRQALTYRTQTHKRMCDRKKTGSQLSGNTVLAGTMATKWHTSTPNDLVQCVV